MEGIYNSSSMKPFILVLFTWISCTNFGVYGNVPLVLDNREVYDLVEWEVVTPQWLKIDHFEVTDKPHIQKVVRFPPEERRYSFTFNNQEFVVLSTEENQLVPSAAKLLQSKKAPRRIMERRDYQPLLSSGDHARHKFAEGLHLRWRHIGASDEVLIAFLYMPTGWPLMLGFTFLCCIVMVPAIGAVFVHLGFKLALVYKIFLWGPLKAVLRWLSIKEQMSNKHWQKHIAPPHFLEPRTSWKLPFVFRNDNFEEIPCELAYKPPINKIDYTMYILTEEDYDEMDLGMDEMEYVDDLLQFRDTNPKIVARLLKYRLGVEKFYYYFDEDILSDESDDEEPPPPPESEPIKPEEGQGAPLVEEEKKVELGDYMALLEIDEPWMHDEYDIGFTGLPYQLEEIRKRRQILNQIKTEIRYLHGLITSDNMFEKGYDMQTDDDRRKALKKTHKLMDKFVRFSNITKERIAEIEPSAKTQIVHNAALSKYLPLVDQMSHYNHRLNLKHEKHKDSARRKLQLEIFGGP